eukprot:9498480-Pyramimonas_sp.AAC.3
MTSTWPRRVLDRGRALNISIICGAQVPLRGRRGHGGPAVAARYPHRVPQPPLLGPLRGGLPASLPPLRTRRRGRLRGRAPIRRAVRDVHGGRCGPRGVARLRAAGRAHRLAQLVLVGLVATGAFWELLGAQDRGSSQPQAVEA